MYKCVVVHTSKKMIIVKLMHVSSHSFRLSFLQLISSLSLPPPGHSELLPNLHLQRHCHQHLDSGWSCPNSCHHWDSVLLWWAIGIESPNSVTEFCMSINQVQFLLMISPYWNNILHMCMDVCHFSHAEWSRPANSGNTKQEYLSEQPLNVTLHWFFDLLQW